MIPFEVSTFKGVNLLIDSSKLQPGEMLQLRGAMVDTGSIVSMPAPSYNSAPDTQIPIPLVFANMSEYTLGHTPPTDTTNITHPLSPSYEYWVAFQISHSIAAHEPITLFILMRGVLSTASFLKITPCIFTSDGSKPLSDVTSARLNQCVFIATDIKRVWRGFTVTSTQALNNAWFVLKVQAGHVDTNCNVVGHSLNTTTVMLSDTGGPWAAWGDAFVGKYKPVYILVKSQVTPSVIDLSSISQCAQVRTPFQSWIGRITSGNSFFDLPPGATWSGCALCVIEIPNCQGSYKRSIVTQSTPTGGNWTGLLGVTGEQYVANVIPSINLVRCGNIIAATAPGVQYCFPIGVQDAPDFPPEEVELGAASFQNIIALGGGGTDDSPANKAPMYIDLQITLTINFVVQPLHKGYAGALMRTFGAAGTPNSPVYVKSFGECLIFFRNPDYPFRMWYGNPGEIDSFNGYENLSQEEKILAVEKYGSDLLIFFSSKIKRFSGVPRYGVLSTAKEIGISSARFVRRCAGVLYVLCDDGFWMYNGAWQKIVDKPKFLERNYGRQVGQASLYAHQEPKLVHVEKYNSIGVMLPVDFYDGRKCTVEFWLYNYLTGDWCKYAGSGVNDQLGLFQMTALPCDAPWIYDIGGSGLLLEHPERFSQFLFETGWIDPDPQIDKKRFLHFTLEATNPSQSLLVDIKLNFDSGVECLFTGVDLRTEDGSVYTKIEKMVPATASRFKVTVSGLATSNEQVKIHKFTAFYEPGKQK